MTKSTPMGSLDYPFNPVSLAIGAEATFVARTIDTDRKHLTVGAAPRGRPQGHGLRRDLPELQHLQRRRLRRGQGAPATNQIRLEHGQPIRFGEDGERGVVQRADGSCELVDVADVGEDALLVHDEHHEASSLAFALSRIAHTPQGPTPIGVFRDVERPVYDELMGEQIAAAKEKRGAGDLRELLHAGDTWTIT